MLPKLKFEYDLHYFQLNSLNLDLTNHLKVGDDFGLDLVQFSVSFLALLQYIVNRKSVESLSGRILSFNCCSLTFGIACKALDLQEDHSCTIRTHVCSMDEEMG